MRRALLIAVMLWGLASLDFTCSPAPIPTPPAPDPKKHSVSLTWVPSPDGLTNARIAYAVYRNGAVIASGVDAGCKAACTYKDSSVQVLTYTYAVKTVLGAEQSAFSNSIEVTVP